MSKYSIPQEPNLLPQALNEYFDLKVSVPGPGQETFPNPLAAALSVQTKPATIT